MNASEDYTHYLRPWLGTLLQALRLDRCYTRAEGNWLFSSEEEVPAQVLDCLGGYGANLFGHYHPRLTARWQALIAAQTPIQAQGSIRPQAAALAKALSDRLGGDWVTTLTNSGAETVEAALKHAELAWRERGASCQQHLRDQAAQLVQQLPELPEDWLQALRALGYSGGLRTREACDFLLAANQRVLAESPVVLALEGAFHGKTLGAVQLTHNPLYRAPFERLNTQFVADPAMLEARLQGLRRQLFQLEQTPAGPNLTQVPLSLAMALFVEPIQGEGGIQVLSHATLQALRALATQEAFPLVLDEIQSGMGRTGTFCYSEQAGVVGDYVLLAKSLGGGLVKIGALLVQREHYLPRFGKIHSSTFAEDDLSAAVALEALRVLDAEQLLVQAAETGAWLKAEIEALQQQYPDVIAGVRGVGLMLGVEFACQAQSDSPGLQMLSKQDLLGYVMTGYLLHEHGVRVAPTLSQPRTLRLEPAATLTREEAQPLLRGLAQLCEVLHKANIYHLSRFLVGVKDDAPIADLRGALDWDAHDPTLPQVAFAGHFIQAQHMPRWDRGFGLFTSEQLEAYLERVAPHLDAEIYDRRTVVSATGARVQLNFLGVCASSRQMNEALRHNPEPVRKLLSEALDKAVEAGCTVMGLGGYHSIVTANGQALPPDRLAITTGNALTVGMGLEAIQQAAAQRGLKLADCCFAALGANGNIASVYSELMAEQVPRLLLIGRPGREPALMKVAERIYRQALGRILTAQRESRSSELQGVAYQIYHSPGFHRLMRQDALEGPEALMALHAALSEQGDQAPIRIATDLQALHGAQLILGASNAPEALIFSELLGSDAAVICDISVPLDTDRSVLTERPDVLVIQGGVVRLPHNPDFHIGGIPLENGLAFACMAETLLMGLNGMQSHYSYGRLHRKQVQAMVKLAELHGFALGRARLENSY